MVKAPVGDKDSGASTGKADFAFDAIASKEINERVEFSGYGGYIVRGSPDEVETTNAFRWGVGAGMPSRKSLRFTAELDGELYADSKLRTKVLMLATDGSFLPVGFESDVKNPFNLNLGLTWHGRNGVFAGLGWTYRFTVDKRDEYLSQYTNGAGDRMDIVGRIGYHPGVRVYVPPPPPPPPPPPAAPAHELSVKASCNPCTVEVGKTSTVSAIANDSIGCSVTYVWGAPTGTFTNRNAQSTPWTAPMQEGPVPVTVTVTCPTDNKTASDTVNIQVVKPAVREITFEDVHFDFDRYSLRPEAVRTLDEAVTVLQQNADVRVEIEGHTCNIGTGEYNLALGERRANPDRQLRRRAAEVRQRSRRDPPSQPPRRAPRPPRAVAGSKTEEGGKRYFFLPSSRLLSSQEVTMRFINMYLVGYFVLLLGAVAALWYGGVLRHVSPIWIVIGLVIAVGLGIMLSVSGGKPEITRE